MREQLLEQLNPLIADFIVKARNGRIRDDKKAKIRISYANAVSNLIRAYNGLLRDIELEELKKELEELKNELEINKERYQ